MVVVYYDLPYLIMVWYGTVLYGRVVFDIVRYGIYDLGNSMVIYSNAWYCMVS